MVKKILYQESRASRRRRHAPRWRWMLEPLDAALLAFAVALIAWLVLLMPV